MNVTKLDAYDYEIDPGVIRIRLAGTTDPDLVDIMSEVDRSNGNIYIDGFRYSYLDSYRLFTKEDGTFIELDVVEL